MLCFIVHGASPPAPEQPLPAGDPLLPPPPPYVSLTAAEQRVARRLLRLAPAAWEPPGRCQRLFLSGLLPSPVRGLLGPPGEVSSEMVCKRKGAGLPACPPCKQPRCAAAEPEPGACQCPAEPQLLALPGTAGEGGGGTAGQSGGGQTASPPPPGPQDEKEQGREEEKERGGEAGCEEPLEYPGDSCRELPSPPTPDINQLPPSILLKVGRDGEMDGPALSLRIWEGPVPAPGVPVSPGGLGAGGSRRRPGQFGAPSAPGFGGRDRVLRCCLCPVLRPHFFVVGNGVVRHYLEMQTRKSAPEAVS